VLSHIRQSYLPSSHHEPQKPAILTQEAGTTVAPEGAVNSA